jgi:hypothetical protein
MVPGETRAIVAASRTRSRSDIRAGGAEVCGKNELIDLIDCITLTQSRDVIIFAWKIPIVGLVALCYKIDKMSRS